MAEPITYEVIDQKLQTIVTNIERNYRENKEHSERLRDEIRSALDDIKKDISDHETRLRNLEKNTTEISTRLAVSQIIQTTFATVASAVAAIIGVFFR